MDHSYFLPDHKTSFIHEHSLAELCADPLDDPINEETLFLLSSEEEKLKQFRSRVEQEKQQLQRDTQQAVQGLSEMFLGVSRQLSLRLDRNYADYQDKYAQFKQVMVAYKDVKHQVTTQMQAQHSFAPGSKVSNALLLQELQDIKVKNQISQVYQNINTSRHGQPSLKELSAYLLHADQPAYRQDAFRQATHHILSLLDTQLEHLLAQLPSLILSYEQHPPQDTRKPLPDTPAPFLDLNRPSKQEPTLARPSKQEPTPGGPSKPWRKRQKNGYKYSSPFTLGQTVVEPVVVSPQVGENNMWMEGVENREWEVQAMSTFETDSSDNLLCIQSLSEDTVVLGTKGKELLLYQRGELGGRLDGHEAGVCCLCLGESRGKAYLLSGGDYACGQLIVWSVESLLHPLSRHQAQHRRLLGHESAIINARTVPSSDRLISVSYNMVMIIWDMESSLILQKSTDIHSANVICFALQDGPQAKAATGSVDGQVRVWALHSQSVEPLVAIENEEVLVCCLALHRDTLFIGDKSGRLSLRLLSGQLLRSIQVHHGPLVECVLIAGQAQVTQVVTLGARSQDLVVVGLQTDGFSFKRVSNAEQYISFGCGVFPKMCLQQRGGEVVLVGVNQKKERQQVVEWRVRGQG